MRDLYRRLGYQSEVLRVDQSAVDDLRRRDPTAAAACRHILLDARRKNVYDRNRRVLLCIGQLRAQLSLNQTEMWTEDDSTDFDFQPSEMRMPQPEPPTSRSTQHTGAKYLAATLFFILCLALAGAAIMNQQDRKNVRTTKSNPTSRPKAPSKKPSLLEEIKRFEGGAKDKASTPKKPIFSEPAVPFPPNGTVRRGDRTQSLAPFEIVTRSGDTNNYFVKLVDRKSNRDVLGLFVRGGQSAKIEVPLGTFEILYTAGPTWYGEKHGFGPDARFAKADKVFDFAIEGDSVSGYTIELYLQPHGNLHTEGITQLQFGEFEISQE